MVNFVVSKEINISPILEPSERLHQLQTLTSPYCWTDSPSSSRALLIPIIVIVGALAIETAGGSAGSRLLALVSVGVGLDEQDGSRSSATGSTVF